MDDKESIKNEAIDETVEKEINLEELNEKNHEGFELSAKDGEVDSKDSAVIDESTKPKSTNKFVEQKAVAQLTEDERSLIIANAKAGLDQPYFDVKFFKNGKSRIIKKKSINPSTSQKVISSRFQSKPENEFSMNQETKPERKIYYSDNQLLFEHIIELNAKVDKLMAKHKKLKRRYQSLQNDIYVNDDDIDDVVDDTVNDKVNDTVNEKVDEPITPKHLPKTQLNSYVQPVSTRSWRSRIQYL